jgi:1,4-dihydroxy-2-naphthoyl-CoA synthase
LTLARLSTLNVLDCIGDTNLSQACDAMVAGYAIGGVIIAMVCELTIAGIIPFLAEGPKVGFF